MVQTLDVATLAASAAEWSCRLNLGSITADALLRDSYKLLQVLSTASKDPQLVSSIAAQAYPLLIDCAARWLETVHTNDDPQTIHEIAQSFGRLLPLAPQVAPLALLFWDRYRNTFYASLLSKTLPNDLRLASLLALFRHIYFDCKTFSCIIDSFSLASLLRNLENVSLHLSSTERYMISELLARRLGVTERKRIELVSTSMGDPKTFSSSFFGTYDGISDIDYGMVPLLEANRIAKGLDLISQAGLADALIEEELDISPLVKNVCGILIPNLSSSLYSSTNLPPDSETFSAVLTPTTIHNIRSVAMALRRSDPLLISGPAGCGKTFLIDQLAIALGRQSDIIRIHLGEQTDAKLLVGNYATGETSGSFEWRFGVLSKAVRDGKWVLIEDLDKAPNDILSVLLPILERNEIFIPSRAETISAGRGFRLIATTRNASHKDLVGGRFWRTIQLDPTPESEIASIIQTRFPLLSKLAAKFVNTFNVAKQVFSNPSFIVLSKIGKSRTVYVRDLFKWVKRSNSFLQSHGVTSSNVEIDSRIYDDIFMDAVDCFAGSLASSEARRQLIDAMARSFEVSPQFVSLLFEGYSPRFLNTKTSLEIGRVNLQKRHNVVAAVPSTSTFAITQHSKRLFEKIGVAVKMQEPLLLVGETGTGKTTVVQQVAKMMNTKLIVINASQQTEASDLLGGFKPVDTRVLAIPLKDEFETIFEKTFSLKRNAQFISIFSKAFASKRWPSVIKIWRQAIKMASSKLDAVDMFVGANSEKPSKRQKIDPDQSGELLKEWLTFSSKVDVFEAKKSQVERSFVFSFVEGQLVQAVRNGSWILLDEINLAAADTLESISELLVEDGMGSILLSEKGEMEVVRAHPNFRLFACMNPATDIGKKDLPIGIRSRFTEIYVPSPDENLKDLMSIVNSYIGNIAVSDVKVCDDVVQLYAQAKLMTKKNMLVDGANTKPHFSIRTLSRTLSYAASIAPTFGLRRALYEGFCMSFLTQLNKDSEKLLNPVIERYTLAGLKNPKSVLSRAPPPPGDPDNFVRIQDFWIEKGPLPCDDQDHYIITPFVEKNLRNLVRAVAGKKFPVLLQGPTSSGKTSIVSYLAKRTGHKFVRINNHEHTDLQEYLGSYVSDSEGVLRFQEGLLVEALRKGYWIVLDELNLAPSDVLEALNRLLDDNRELLIPETQEVVKPHPHFMLFAAQNPPGLYGGRKVLSRAFRNRFLELHFDDIPEDELEIILRERCRIAPSYAKKIIQVYQELASQRQSTRLFEQRQSFATLRDLFRWANRPAVGYEELATNGYLLLGERVRNREEKSVVKGAIEKVMRAKISAEDLYYHSQIARSISSTNNLVVWTKAMLRLFYLVSEALKNNEPVLLVGETGCGKTTVCQIIANISERHLHIVNAHQNTETGDLIGSQRPVRGRQEIGTKLKELIVSFFDLCSFEPNKNIPDLSVDELFTEYQALKTSGNSSVVHQEKESLSHSIEELYKRYMVLFDWHDGSLVQALREGSFFLLDEISLADDSVLERLNSVLEPERTLTLAGSGLQESVVTATDGFQFLATMNPGGDYGKKELSPALRNRFTEIWVPSLDDFSDVLTIIESKLTFELQALSKPICVFAEWFHGRYADQGFSSCALSLRDVLAWVIFINSTYLSVGKVHAFAHGAALVFLDSLGTNNTSYMATIPGRIASERSECLNKLSSLVNHDLSFISSPVTVNLSDSLLKAGDFSIPVWRKSDGTSKFSFDTPTTANNAARVIRGMQLHKPILLEGSPGVGKTSLVTALASACGRKLTRINLSEQTDLMDLFGSDVPVEGGRPGEFTWSSAPFLTAMEKGEWVLLDEMNLASQSVLEGLNACLDHRGETYIPELDKAFTSHPGFTVFAAQNPHSQGGGRKGLPKSFVNRFTVVYVDLLDPRDLVSITTKLYPPCPPDLVEKVTNFMSMLDSETTRNRSFGGHGGPWEFNLRDAMRYLDLLCSTRDLEKGLPPYEWIDVTVRGRFRSNNDKQSVDSLYLKAFGHPVPKRSITYAFNSKRLRVGHSVLKREGNFRVPDTSQLNLLQCNLSILESLITCVNNGWASILVGPPASGKSSVLKSLATIAGVRLEEFAMNSEVDSVDIIGSFEQEDLTRKKSAFLSKVDQVSSQLYANLICNTNELMSAEQDELLCFLQECLTRNDASVDVFFKEIYSILNKLSRSSDCLIEFSELQKEAAKLDEQRLGPASFEWFDGILVQALEEGFWLVLDNANLCSPTVLDRLNSLLEPDGVLVVNERRVHDGQPKVVVPHKNFRLFLTMDPRHGELSRAMRNRCVEIYFDPLLERITLHDRRLLHRHLGLMKVDLTDSMMELSLSERVDDAKYPVFSFLNIGESEFQLTAMVDEFLHLSSNPPESDTISATYYSSSLELSRLRRWQVASDRLNFLTKKAMQCYDYLFTITSQSYDRRRLLEARMDTFYESAIKACPSYFESFRGNLPFSALLDTSVARVIFGVQKPTSIEKSLALLRETWFRAYSLYNKLEIMQKSTQNTKPRDRNYLEKSMLAALSDLSDTESLRLGKFANLLLASVRAAINLAEDALRSLSPDDILAVFKLASLNLDTYQLTVQKSVDESQLRVVKNFYVEWVCDHDTPTTKELAFEVNSFGNNFFLRRGVLMEKIWAIMKPNLPLTKEGWSEYQSVCTLVENFDDIASKLDQGHFEMICQLKRKLLDLASRLSVNEPATSAIEAMKSNLGSLSESLTRNTTIAANNPNFDALYEYLVAFQELDMSTRESLNNEGRQNSLMALATYGGQRTLLLKPFYESLPDCWASGYVSHIRHFSEIGGSVYGVQNIMGGGFLSSSIKERLEMENTPMKAWLSASDNWTIFIQQFSKRTPIILNDRVSQFCRLLYNRFKETLGYLSQIAGDERSAMFENTLSGLLHLRWHETGLPPLEDDYPCNDCIDDVWYNHFYPSLKLIQKSYYHRIDDRVPLRDLGRAWILFSSGLLKLYLPDAPLDPAIKPYVENQFYNNEKLRVSERVESERSLRATYDGSSYTAVIDALENHSATMTTSNSVAYRPPVSQYASLHAEMLSIWSSALSTGLIEDITDAAYQAKLKAKEAMNSFQINTDGFLTRVANNFPYYRDVTAPLEVMICDMKVGFGILDAFLRSQLKEEDPNSLAWTVDQSFIVNTKKINEMIKTFHYQDIEKPVCYSTVIYLLSLCRLHNIVVKPECYAAKPCFDELLDEICRLWSVLKDLDEKASAEDKSLYKYSHNEAEDDEDFHLLFPDYENEEPDKSTKRFKSTKERLESDPRLMNAYMSLMTDEAISLDEVLSNGFQIVLEQVKSSEPIRYASRDMEKVYFPFLSHSTRDALQSRAQGNSFNFYTDSDLVESQKCCELLTTLQTDMNHLIQEWPDNMVLQDISNACDVVLEGKMSTPLAKMLQQIEAVHKNLNEWEKVASKEVSLKQFYNAITELIVSWRKEELSCWARLLDFQEQECSGRVAKWWFYLYENIIFIPSRMGIDKKAFRETLPEVINAVTLFIGQSSLGEFSTRLSLVHAFSRHALQKSELKPFIFLRQIGDSLENLIAYFNQFLPAVQSTLSVARKSLEKEMKEVILLASWKDVNIDALRESSRRSHYKLYKIIRKYRTALNRPAKELLDGDIPKEGNSEPGHDASLIASFSSYMSKSFDLDKALEIYTQSRIRDERPDRLLEIARTERIMKRYIDKLGIYNGPSLEDYVQQVVAEADSLRNETPSILTDDTKKHIQQLKSRKRKLLSDTMKDLRAFGIRENVRPDILTKQSSVNSVIESMGTLNKSVQGVDFFFLQILHYLPSLRANAASHSPDLSTSEVQRGMGQIENLFHILMEKRDGITGLLSGIELCKKLSELIFANDIAENMQLIQDPNLRCSEVRTSVIWAPRILNYFSGFIEMKSKLDKQDYSVVLNCLKNWEQKFLSIFDGVDPMWLRSWGLPSSQTVAFLETSRNMLKLFRADLSNAASACPGFRAISKYLLSVLEACEVSIDSDDFLTGHIRNVPDYAKVDSVSQQLCNSILIVIQSLNDIDMNFEQESDWYTISHSASLDLIKALHISRINDRLRRCIITFKAASYGILLREHSDFVLSLFTMCTPFIKAFLEASERVLKYVVNDYYESSKALYRLEMTLSTLFSKGFCGPEETEKESESQGTKSGSALGEGEGAETREADDDDQEALEDMTKEDKNEDESGDVENDKAQDVDGDFEGISEDLGPEKEDESDDLNDEDSLDSEVDDNGDLDSDAVDEKMWDEEVGEDGKERETNEKNSSTEGNEVEAGAEENEDQQSKDELKEDKASEDQNDDPENGSDDEYDEEEAGVDNDDILPEDKDNSTFQAPEVDTMDLPDDMNLDQDVENDIEEEEEEADELDEEVMEDSVDLSDSEDSTKEQQMKDVSDEEGEQEEDGQEPEKQIGEDLLDPTSLDNENENENEDRASSEEQDKNGDRSDTEKDQNDEEDKERELRSRADESNEEGSKANGIEENSLMEQDENTGEQSNGVDGQEQSIGDDNNETEQKSEMAENSRNDLASEQIQKEKEESFRNAANSLQQLGNALEQYYGHRDIQEASEHHEEDNREADNADIADQEVQHVEGPDTSHDTQALGNATEKMQQDNIDQSASIEDDISPPKTEHNTEPLEVENEGANTDFDETKRVHGTTSDAYSSLAQVPMGDEIMELDMDEEASHNDDLVGCASIEYDDLSPYRDLDEARTLWTQHERETQTLVTSLCEQLRLILAPTLSTKLRGDFRTGKRLNLKRIIPYIASDFKKDKIWLRRTKPSKREYQIMIAVDDSKSMAEPILSNLAFDSIALVSKALTQLESGQISIVSFGEQTRLLHPFQAPFTPEAGARAFQWFGFNQTKTDVQSLANSSLKYFEEARLQSSSDLWQLEIIISDGMCEDHETLRRIVRRAREEKVMIVFVIVDTVENGSILETSQARYEEDEEGNMTLKVEKYLDKFPFEYYVIVRNVVELPGVLSTVLRQYFAQVSELDQ